MLLYSSRAYSPLRWPRAASTARCKSICFRSCNTDVFGYTRESIGETQFMYRFRNNERNTVEKAQRRTNLIQWMRDMNERRFEREERSDGARARKPMSNHHKKYPPRTYINTREGFALKKHKVVAQHEENRSRGKRWGRSTRAPKPTIHDDYVYVLGATSAVNRFH